MKVFKFGGASVKNADAVKNVARIISDYPEENIVIVISAMGKMTNAFEALWISMLNNENSFIDRFEEIKGFHDSILKDLSLDQDLSLKTEISKIYEGIENLNVASIRHHKDYLYDQVVSCGELLSTTIVSRYLTLNHISNKWFDARQLVKTDFNFREAKVDWQRTGNNIRGILTPFFENENGFVAITQGFLGGADLLNTTTLGREGSDYSASIFAYSLDADEVVIWKDVPGVLNADPKYFSDTVKLESISFTEAIELAYYGASVIHPKTIQPLQNKNIPLEVKSFIRTKEKGTLISSTTDFDSKIPSYIFKQNQKLISIGTKDFAFVVEENLREIFDLFSKHRVKINMMQNSAIKFSIAVDEEGEKTQALIKELSKSYTLLYNNGLTLVTIRHYNRATIEKLIGEGEVLLEQKTRSTYRALIKG